MDARAPMSGKPRALKRFCCFGCSAAVVAAGVFAFLLLSPPPRPKPLTPTERAAAVERVKAVRREVESIAKDVRAGKSRDFSIEIGEAELNELLTDDPDVKAALDRLEIEDPFLAIEEGEIQLFGTRSVSGVGVTSSVSIAPKVDRTGRLVLAVRAARLGRLGLPGRFHEKLAEALRRHVTDKINDQKLRLRTARVAPGKLLIEGTAG